MNNCPSFSLTFFHYIFCVFVIFLQCRLSESMSPDDEYRSSRNIAISLFKRYRNFVERGGGDNLKVYSVVHVIFLFENTLLFPSSNMF